MKARAHYVLKVLWWYANRRYDDQRARLNDAPLWLVMLVRAHRLLTTAVLWYALLVILSAS